MELMEEYKWIVSLPSLLGISFLGMLMHFFKKQITGETLGEITSFFTNHLKSTMVAFTITMVTTVAYFLALSTETPADILTAFGLGYMCDSGFNKWDKTDIK